MKNQFSKVSEKQNQLAEFILQNSSWYCKRKITAATEVELCYRNDAMCDDKYIKEVERKYKANPTNRPAFNICYASVR